MKLQWGSRELAEGEGTLSRRRMLTMLTLAACLALAALLSACGGGGGGSSEDPQKVIEQATFKGVESGELALALKIKSTGEEAGDVKVDLSGPFQSTGKKSLPELGMEVSAKGTANGEKVDFEGGLTVLNDRAYVGYKGKEYEIDPTTFGFIKSGFEEAEQEGEGESKGAKATACQKAATSLDLSEFADNLENEGGEDVDGVKTTKLSGDLNAKKAVAAIIGLAETPACSSEFEAAGAVPLDQLKAAESELTGAIKKAHVDLYVGEDDHIVRKVVAATTIEPKASAEKVEVEFEFTLSKVNEKQKIAAPANAEPLTGLFGELGLNLNDIGALLEGGGSEGFGGLIEGLMNGKAFEGSSSGESSGLEELIPPAFQECLNEATGAADIQKCSSLME
jgi:hypothetical protein